MKKIHHVLSLVFLMMLSFTLSSCSKKLMPEKNFTLANDIIGVIQKGPFINGSSINYFILDSNFNQIGTVFNTQTTDNIGSFLIKKGPSLETSNVLFVAQGFYFNEVTGKTSDVPLTLTLVSDLADSESVNINLLTSLEKDRILYLIGEGKTFQEASQQAQQEVLSIFFMSSTNVRQAQNLNIAESGDDNAVLLAISMILQGNRPTSELSNLIAGISLDIEKDGILDNQDLQSQLNYNGKLIDVETVRSNLTKFYADNGITAKVPDFAKYIKLFNSSNTYKVMTRVTYPEKTNINNGGLIGDNGLALNEIIFQDKVLDPCLPGYSCQTYRDNMSSIWGFSALVDRTEIVVKISSFAKNFYVTFNGGTWEYVSKYDQNSPFGTINYEAHGISLTEELRFDGQFLLLMDGETLENNSIIGRIDIYEFDTGTPSRSINIRYKAPK